MAQRIVWRMLTARPTNFPEAKIIVPDVYEDDRGFFKESYSKRKYAEIGVTDDWLQDGVSLSAKNVIRGMHYQPGMAKLVNALAGEIYDVIVDIRQGSPTFKKWQGFHLSAGNHLQLYVPDGFAHGFLAMTDGVVLHYKMSAHHNPATEAILSWRDPSVGIDWPLSGVARLSRKDAEA
ncbi:MAG TPA: dTDP-4-dehydrorhamnose 3,5-epimerase [Candidatus Eremiobacteraceae bacterium]|jgi:dTDP-4-dehydrorhamnose 3,5-epimerase